MRYTLRGRIPDFLGAVSGQNKKYQEFHDRTARFYDLADKPYRWLKGKRDFRREPIGRSSPKRGSGALLLPGHISAFSQGSRKQKKAAQLFDTIVSAIGDSGSLHVLFGHAYREAEMQDDAIRELRKAIALDTRTLHAHYFPGLALLWNNEWTDTPEIRQEFVTELNSGRPDIYIANDSTPSFLYKNLGNGKFKEIGLESGTAVSQDGSEQASMGIAIGDYNHTGRPSIYTTNFSDEYDDLYRNDGNWNFTDVSYQSGIALPSLPYVKWGTAFADFDNDGWLDLIAVSGHVYPQVDSLPSGGGYREPKLLHLNQTDGTFCDARDLAGPALQERHVSRGLAVGDLFNDGNVDIVVGDLDGAPMILKNHGVPGRHWVSFDLAGAKSNRMAIGARVKLVASGMTQSDEVHSGGSYLSQNDTRLHFGLGFAKKIDHVEIRWPSGALETLTDLAADQFYSVLEGSGVVPANRIRPAAPKGSR